MKSLCIVTDALHPFTPGDRGRIIDNILQMSGKAAYLTLLLPAGCALDPEAVRARYHGRVEVHLVAPRLLSRVRRDTVDERLSLDIAATLKSLRKQGTRFDFVEFPDVHGWAAASLDARRALGHGPIAVRLFGTDGMRRARANEAWTSERDRTATLEQHSLKTAERIIAPFWPVADGYAEFYGFNRAWRRRVRVELPPVHGLEPIPPAEEPGNDIVFPRPLQPLERPDLFVEGVVAFMQAVPRFPGRAVFAPPGDEPSDPEVLRLAVRAVPADLAPRFGLVDPPERSRAMARGIVVIPAAHETLCLTAFDAAAAGAPLVLNGMCPAFGLRTIWDKADAALRFDGTPASLARTLDAAWRSTAWAPRGWPPERPYWI